MLSTGSLSSSFDWMVVFICFVSFFCLPRRIQAQTTTDTDEALALNTIFSRWDISAPSSWNISGDPCTGAATDSTSFDDNSFNPFIKCDDCSDNNGTTCHITHLKVYALDVTGPVPEELQSFPQLSNLNLGQNYLTGSLPAFLGNFSKMQYMTFGINALSGNIPKELGNLTTLISLGLGSNNFSGSLPLEFGNLTNLQQLYIDSSGVSGEIPPTFGKLQNLQIIWASGNGFTGTIPDFIGDLTNLTDLRLQGNSFQGPIPSSMAKLTKLTNLRIGDLTNGTSSMAFIQNMTTLSTLVLRNCNISDVIPSNFGTYTSLQLLDLSFNSLSGQLPQSLFNLDTLTYLRVFRCGQPVHEQCSYGSHTTLFSVWSICGLIASENFLVLIIDFTLQYRFLGNNTLSGSLPTEKSLSLVNIDLSYNNLSGSFPAWVSNENLNLNLVANNFVLDGSNNSILSSGLDCLQKDIPCNRGSPIWSSFAINCGGSRRITSSDGTIYEPENENITAASYYLSATTKWATSNVGRFGDSPNHTYVQSTSSQFTNTLDSELFQSAKISPSSLRYYGIGLENGNYTVELQFAETAFPNLQSWKSVGKRIFDIYIQGNLVVKDFDIRKEASGTSFRAIARNYFANVTENFLEIHFFWAGKGTCCIPTQGTYGPLISAISVTPNFIPTVSNQLPSTKKNNMALIIGLVIGITAVCVSVLLGVLIWRKKRTKSNMNDGEELLGLAVKSDIFSYAELRTATSDFSLDNKLGEGGFGTVFKGKLSDGRLVAVKQLAVTSHQGKRQFVAEIETISAVQHRNLVTLYGCCFEGDKRLLIYEYLENRSLDQALFGQANLILDWPSRFAICMGTARALAYLHEESSVRIVHRDVKASNILLDSDLNPKISDFGLAKLYDDKKTHISTRIAGTIGYLAPEYALRGHLTEKADVFGFGVVALETLTGRPNTDLSLGPNKMYLLEWAWHLHENNIDLDMMDTMLSSYDKLEAIRVIGVALLCTQTMHSLRPPMSRVVSMLAGDIEVSEVTSKPTYLTDWQYGDISSTIGTNDSGVSASGAAGSRTSTSHQETAPSPSSSTSTMLGGADGEGR